MQFAPLLAAPPLVQAHAAAAIAAFGLGLWQMAAPKGTLPHRRLGWAWTGLMLVVALSSFGITGNRGPWHFSWIHGISLFTLVMLPLAVLHARRGRVGLHRRAMIGLFLGALVITGAFTLLPGRLLGRVVFS
ncbi:DUF2306 domain-containing protein [Paracraurococcus ruber]|uniref:DUF2306 domain-containing protein n=1 Tax=Paracraurococcus ruber TaxID=77675 RepID=A0ABS1D8B4_9PROT|nr:DUF2306 domain-containing protein [Paracraurococcus ruber]MBK1662600.1 hypothetical protein [Paracraurococcus ruber]TDG14399.1 DUF2306 domain-containing protein [Paracraurococcus ruber]